MVSGQSCAAISILASFKKRPLKNNTLSFAPHLSIPTWCWKSIHEPDSWWQQDLSLTMTRSSVLENSHVFGEKLLSCHHFCAIIQYSCWEPYSESQVSSPMFPVATAQTMSAYVEIFSISAQACSCSPWGCSCFHRDIYLNHRPAVTCRLFVWKNFLNFSGKLMLTVWTGRGGHWYQVHTVQTSPGESLMFINMSVLD